MNQPDIHFLLNKQPILLFDGECVFCNKTLLFYLKHEKKAVSAKKQLHFSALQTQAAQVLKNYFELDERLDSLILIRDHSAFIKSCAALRLTGYMKGLWPLMQLLLIIPPFIRNAVYDYIAKRRKKYFGRSVACRIFTEDENARMI